MITKETFFNFINEYLRYEKCAEKLGKILGVTSVYESEPYEIVSFLLKYFIDSHFTELGSDIIYWYLFEDVDHTIYYQPDLFGNKVEYTINSLDDLWNYLISDKKLYFLDGENS